ncbi:unnamed protein product [Amoebophrya sp. A120]|nr:unnamed protein product [Amoebophrya sp. A120]|eukprot:GSA120T00009136001.1
MSGPRQYTQDPAEMFVGNLVKDNEVHSTKALRTFFEQFGPVKDVDVKKDRNGLGKGFAFVQFEDSSSVDTVLQTYDNNYLGGVWLDCKKSVDRSQRAPPKGGHPPAPAPPPRRGGQGTADRGAGKGGNRGGDGSRAKGGSVANGRGGAAFPTQKTQNMNILEKVAAQQQNMGGGNNLAQQQQQNTQHAQKFLQQNAAGNPGQAGSMIVSVPLPGGGFLQYMPIQPYDGSGVIRPAMPGWFGEIRNQQVAGGGGVQQNMMQQNNIMQQQQPQQPTMSMQQRMMQVQQNNLMQQQTMQNGMWNLSRVKKWTHPLFETKIQIMQDKSRLMHCSRALVVQPHQKEPAVSFIILLRARQRINFQQSSEL